MPGAQNRCFRLGNWTELLVESCLNAIAFTARVPRQEDVGHDFFCILSDTRDNLVWAGPSFTVQAKSDSQPLVFEKPHQIKWVKELESPFFLAVGHRDKLQIDIYSTWARLNGFLRKEAGKIVLQPGPPSGDRSNPWTADDRSEQVIALGEPIIRATIQDFLDASRAKRLCHILRQWIVLDRQNIVSSETGMYWVVGPQAYKTNEPFTSKTTFIVWTYANAQNLQTCERNFQRAATSLRVTIRQRFGEEKERMGFGMAKLDGLDAALRASWTDLEPLSQCTLREIISPTKGEDEPVTGIRSP